MATTGWGKVAVPVLLAHRDRIIEDPTIRAEEVYGKGKLSTSMSPGIELAPRSGGKLLTARGESDDGVKA